MNNASQFPVRVKDIADIALDPERGIISLVGDHGGLSLITGDITASAVIRGTIGIETEHGTVYLDPEVEVLISEATALDEHHEWLVEWNINSYGPTPQAAAARVWVENFGRTVAGDDDACVFTVKDPDTLSTVTIDLSECDLDKLL